MIRKARVSDVPSLAKIHKSELEGEFLTRLGENFLRSLYYDFTKQKNTILYLKKNKQVQGFIVGVTDFSSVFYTIIKTHFFHYLRLLAPQFASSPRLLIETLSTIFYPLQEGTTDPEAELVVIAVLNEYQRQKIGSQLLAKLEEEFKKHNISSYKVSCTVKNRKANNFYRKHSFVLTRHFRLYSKQWHMYVKNL